MIYLIGGPPRCGKTTIARNLANRLQVPWVPADYLGSVVYHYIPHEEYPRRFPLSYLRSMDGSNDWLYARHTAGEIATFYQTQAQTVWPGIQIFVGYAAHDGQDSVLEGYQIQPDLVNGLKGSDFCNDVKAAFVHKTDEAGIIEGFGHTTAARDWLIDNTSDEETFPRVARMISLYGRYVQAEAARYGFASFNMSGDFAARMEEVIEFLASG